MEQKKAYEQYRVAAFASPHPAHSAAAASQAQASAGAADGEVIQPDTQRVILHFDVDAFYAQVEEVRAPHLRGVPMGVTQKYLIVTCNYPARAAGVTKLMGITEAKQRCPGIVLIPGEDLSPYRAASKAILSVLSRFGPAEKLGMDETFVDVTREVEARIASGQAAGAAAAVASGATATCSAAVAASPAAGANALPAAAPAEAFGSSADPASSTPYSSGLNHSNTSTSGGSRGWGYGWKGHVHVAGCSRVGAASRHRPQDLRVVPSMHQPPPAAAAAAAAAAASGSGGGGTSGSGGGSVLVTAATMSVGAVGGTGAAQPAPGEPPAPADQLPPSSSAAPHPELTSARSLTQAAAETPPEVLLRLMVGSWMAAEARAAVAAEAGFRCSGGVACNKMLAKLVSGLHKPDDQTVMLPSEAAAFVAPLPARALPGVGFKTDGRLRALGVETAGQLRALGRVVLCEEFGAKLGPHLWDLARGRDATPVLPSGPPKSITVEDSFRSCSSWGGVERVLGVLVPDLMSRLAEEWAEHRRSPATLTLKWRHRGTGWNRSSASCQLPLASAAALTSPPCAEHVAVVSNAALKLLRQHLPPGFNLSLLNVGATAFKEAAAAGAIRCVAALLQARSTRDLTKSMSDVDHPVMGGDAAVGAGPTGLAAAAHLEARRDYDAALTAAAPAAGDAGGWGSSSGSGNGSRAVHSGEGGSSAGQLVAGGWMSKSRERQLREQHHLQPQQQQHQDHRHQQQHHQQQQQQASVLQYVLTTTGRKRSPAAPLSQLEAVLAVKRSKVDPLTSLVKTCEADLVKPGSNTPALSSGAVEQAHACTSTAAAAAAGAGGRGGGRLTPYTEAAAVCQPSVGIRVDTAAQQSPEPVQAAVGPASGAPDPPGRLAMAAADAAGSQWQAEPGPSYNAAHVGSGWGIISWEMLEGWEEEEEEEQEQHGEGDQEALMSQQHPQQDCVQEPQQQLLLLLQQQQQQQQQWQLDHQQQQLQQQQWQSDPQQQQQQQPLVGVTGASRLGGPGGADPEPHWDLCVSDSEDWEQEHREQQQQQQQQQQQDHGLAAAPEPLHSRPPGAGSSRGAFSSCCGPRPAPEAAAAAAGTPPELLYGSTSKDAGSHGNGSSNIGSRSDVRCVVLHIDVDCFYCQVERLDDPSLAGVPLAVTQFNAGGFVAVSYEARAAGIQCGDGVGEVGRAALPHLKKIGAVSLQEALRKCPGLVVRPMRTDRYRQVASQLHTLLASCSPDGSVEKASYDDFYIDISAWCCQEGVRSAAVGQAGQPSQATAAAGAPAWLDAMMQQWGAMTAGNSCSSSSSGGPAAQLEAPGLQRVFVQLAGAAAAAAAAACTPGVGSHGGTSAGSTSSASRLPAGWDVVEPALQRGTAVAVRLRRLVKQQMGLTVSCGVAPGKLLARLVGPQNKPDAITVLPAASAVPWMGQQQLRAIPYLRGKTGQSVVASLGVGTAQQLSQLGLSQQQLMAQFGGSTGELLYWLPHGRSGSSSPVRERGPPKSLMVERSFPPLTRPAAVKEALVPLVNTLWVRLLETTAVHRRLPVKLGLTWRQGYGAPRTASAAAPGPLADLMRPLLTAGALGREVALQHPQQQQQQQQGTSHATGDIVPPPRSSPHPSDTSSDAAGVSGEEAAGESPYSALLSPGAQHIGTRSLLEAYLGIFRGAAGGMCGHGGAGGLQVTRLAVSVLYAGDGIGGGAGGGVGGGGAGRGRVRQLEGQQTLQGFRKRQ